MDPAIYGDPLVWLFILWTFIIGLVIGAANA